MQALARETAEAYRRGGVHPLGALTPLLIQTPLLLALLQALDHAVHGSAGAAMASFAVATVLGVPLAFSALTAGWPGALVGGTVLVATAAAQMLTQHLGTAPDAPGARLLLLLPLATAAVGAFLPLGVTAYWGASAVWTLGQQAVLRRVVRG